MKEKTKVVYRVVVKSDGKEYSQYLLPKELYLLATILKEKKSAEIERLNISEREWKFIYG